MIPGRVLESVSFLNRVKNASNSSGVTSCIDFRPKNPPRTATRARSFFQDRLFFLL